MKWNRQKTIALCFGVLFWMVLDQYTTAGPVSDRGVSEFVKFIRKLANGSIWFKRDYLYFVPLLSSIILYQIIRNKK